MHQNPKLTIGMATYHDYDGTFFTLNSIILHHEEILDEVELIVVDNDPNGEHGKRIKECIQIINRRNLKYKAKYIAYTETVGPANAKNKIFEVASGDFVMSVDCHVLFPSGCLKKLLDYLEENTNTSDLMHGPLMGEDGQLTTNLNYQWRTEMLGTWGKAWKYNDIKFSVIKNNDLMKTVSLSDGRTEIILDELNNYNWLGHEQRLESIGCVQIGIDENDLPFEIPAHGMGMFVCSRKYWPSFNKNILGFGGEEFYIHGKHRAYGHNVVLLPFLRWLHRFHRPNNIKYPLTAWNKIRNYVLEFKELEWDLEEIYNHFGNERNKISRQEWLYLIQNTKKAINRPTYENYLSNVKDIESVYNLTVSAKSSLNQNLHIIKKYADKSQVCVDYSLNGQTAVALLASNCKNIFLHNIDQNNAFLKKALELTSDKNIKIEKFEDPDYENIDLLMLDNTTEGDDINKLLNRLYQKQSLKKYIIINNTIEFADKSISKNNGVMVGIKNFLKEQPDFIMLESSGRQNGLIVLGNSSSAPRSSLII